MVPVRNTWIARLRSSLFGVSRRRRAAVRHTRPESLESRMLLTATLDHFVTTEHTDLRAGFNGTNWSLGIHEGLQGALSTDEALIYVGNNATTSRPGGNDWNFTGVAAGQTLYYGAQTQEDGLLYLGAAAYDVPAGLLATTNPSAASKGRQSGSLQWMKFSMLDVQHTQPNGTAGTGHFSVWSNGSFGNPTVLASSYNDDVANPNGLGLDTTDGISADDSWWLPSGAHAHYNFGFSAPGRYEVQLQLSAPLAGGGTSTSDPFTVYFSVGSVGQVEFDMASYTVAEDGGSATIDVRRVGGSDGEITVDYAASNGTATAGADYTATSGTITFADGETTKQIVVPILNDAVAEGDETVNLTLSAPGPETIVDFLDFYEDGLLGPQSTATLTITDSSPNSAPSISDIVDRFVTEGSSTGAIAFTVGDTETAAGDLIVTATSSNQAVIPNGNIVLGGSGANRTVTITPAEGQYGPTTITLTVTDGNGAQSNDTFVLTVVANHLVPFTMPSYQGPGVGPSGFQSQMADFNGDGKLDLIVAGSGGNALGYRQGVGDGSFMPEQLLNAGSGLSAQGIVAVDYDGDNDMDLVAQEYVQSVANTGTITLYRNNGTASFTRVVLASGHPESYRVVAGDLNGDGRTDLVYGKALSTVAYALQQPSGELGAEVALPVTFGSAQGVLLGDMDNDNDLDIVVSNRANGVNAYFSVFSNDGSGVFSAPQNTTTGIFPTALQLVDMNGDGRLDVVTGQSVVGSRAGYYPQLANGTFGSRVVVLPTNTQLNSIRVADINGDGIPDIAAGAIVGGAFSMVWSPGLGGGAFGNTILIDPNQGNAFSLHVADLDGDNNPDIVTTGTRSETLPSAIRVYINKTGENPMVLVPPAARTRVASDPIDLQVYFGFPITVTGTPRIALDVGGNTAYANYVSGSGTSTLTFRYTVTATDLDLDGVQLASNLIDLNGGTLTDPISGPAVLEFPNQLFTGVIANGAGPLVSGISRLDARSTDAATVRFQIQFNEDVTGVDPSDFDVVMNAGDLSGATIQSVTGSGNLYEVTVTTGTGSGTLGLSVNGTASILDLSGVVLARAFVGGEVYTVRKAPLSEIDIYYTHGHADYRPVFNNGEFSYVMHGDPGVLPEIEHDSDEVYTYADSNALVNRPASANYNFTGVDAGAPLYVLPSTQNANLPFLGLSGDSLVAGTFAAYRPTEDPRITSATIREYVKVQMVGMRSSSGGEFSLYSGTTPTVWMASSDGISASDNFWLYRTHFHRNLAFSKPGIYEVDVVLSGYLDSNANGAKDATDVYTESGIKTMVFNVDTLGAVSDAYTLYGNGQLQGSVTVNDSWNDSLGAMTASVETSPTKGSLTLQADGTFTYVPSELFDGSDSFVYRLTNSRGGFTTATATITGSALPEFHAGLTQGHGDLGMAFEGGAWDLHVHVEGEEHEEGGGEEHEHGGLEYGPDQILIQVGPASATTMPANPAFSFIGASSGSGIFVLPAVQNPALPFLGFATEEIEDGTFRNDEMTLRLKSVSGPGFYSVWSTDGFGTPTPHLTTADGIDGSDVLVLGTGVHVHLNMAFTAAGVYAITVEATGVLESDGSTVSSGDVTYYFAINTGAAPAITLPEAVTTYTEQATAKIVASNISLTDADSVNFDGGQLRVDIPVHSQTGDELLILHHGNGTNQIGVSGNTVTIGVTGGSTLVLGTFTGGTNGDPLVVSLTDQATPARVQALMRRIAFRNLTDDPTNEERGVRFVVADGDGEISDAVIREVAVTPVNDAPVVIASGGSVSYTENDPSSVIDSGVSVTDVDSPDFDGGKLTITIAVNRQTTDRLTILAQGDGTGEINVSGFSVLYEGVVIGTYSGGYTSSNPLVVTLNPSATPMAVQQLARRVAFHNSGDNPTDLTRTVSFVVSDGDGKTSLAATKTVDVTAVNDAPVISNIGAAVNYKQNTAPVVVSGSAVVGDPDSANFQGGALTVSLVSGGIAADEVGIRSQGVGNGRINLDGANVTYGVGGVAVVIGTWSGGSGTDPLVVSLNSNATPVAVQSLLRNITFRVIGATPASARTIRFSLTDGDGGTSLDIEKQLNVMG